jgi:hypothetical protein
MVLANHRSGRSTSSIIYSKLNIILNYGTLFNQRTCDYQKTFWFFLSNHTCSGCSIEPFELSEHSELCDTIGVTCKGNLNDSMIS